MLPVTTAAAILIDADNLQDETWLEAVREQVRQRAGRLPVIRAYGSNSKLQSRAALWARLGAEMLPHLPLDKNTTDASLIVDAVELCCRDGVRFFAIASGDADFAPLAVRLRARGCEVWCFAVTQTLFGGAQLYYDKVVRFEKPPGLAPVVVADKAAVAGSAQVAGPKYPAIPTPVAVQLPLPVPATPQKPKVADPPVLVFSVLNACPELRSGKEFPLAIAIPMLRKQGVIGQTERPKSWAIKLAPYFELTPAAHPHAMRYVGRPAVDVPFDAAGTLGSTAASVVRELSGSKRPRTTAQVLPPQWHALRAALWRCANSKVSVAEVLVCIPELLERHQRFSLSSVASRLRSKGLLADSQSAVKILGSYPTSFKVDLAALPQSVRYLG